MLKIAGVILCVAGAAFYGMIKISEWDMAIKELEQWILLLKRTKSIIYYRRDIIADVFCGMDEDIYGIGGEFIASVGNELRVNRSQNLIQIWRERMQEWRKVSVLPGEIKRVIMDLPEYIGEQDYEQQINHLDFFLSRLQTEKDKLEKAMENKKKPLMAISLAGGITISLLLL